MFLAYFSPQQRSFFVGTYFIFCLRGHKNSFVPFADRSDLRQKEYCSIGSPRAGVPDSGRTQQIVYAVTQHAS